MTQQRLTIAVLSSALLLGAQAAHAAWVSVSYSGTVTTAASNGAPLPAGVTQGAAVTGSFRFDPATAGSPSYDLISCGGNFCGGDGIIANFPFQANLIETVTIAGQTWTQDVGQVFLIDDHTIPGLDQQTVGLDSSVTGYGALLSLTYGTAVGAVPLIPDFNTIAGVDFASIPTWGGTINTGASGYYVGYIATVPEPGAPLLASLTAPLLLLALRRR